MAAISRSSRQDSLAAIASTGSPDSDDTTVNGHLHPNSSLTRPWRDRPSSPTNYQSIPKPPTQPIPCSASSSYSSTYSGFQVTSRPKTYNPPSPGLLAQHSPNPSPYPSLSLGPPPNSISPDPSCSRQTSLSKSGTSSNASTSYRPAGQPQRATSGSSSAGRPTRSNSPPSASAEPKTTLTLSSSIDAQGRRMVNQYVRLKTIGQGSHGKVWLCAQPSIRRRARDGDDDDSPLDGVSGTASGGEGLGRKRSAKSNGKTTISWDDDEFDEDSVEYCAIKSVAREGTGKGKSLRLAKGRKATGTQGIGADDKVKREVAIMKRLDHGNVVRLKEVIDDVKSKKVFMVLEFMAGGQITWQDDHKRPTMSVDEARHTFRDVVLGLEYLHYQGIIHRDIKPANLLWNEDRSIVKISDFGVSHVSDALLRATPGEDDGCGEDDRALRKTAGSPAFFAPELCHPAEYTPTPTNAPDGADANYFPLSANTSRASHDSQSIQDPTVSSNGIPLSKTMISKPLPPPDPSQPKTRPTVGRGIDVWALGVTLYCLLFGDSPFMASTEYELYNVIVKEGILVPTKMGREGAWTGYEPGWPGCGDGVEGREAIDLLGRLLEKDPAKRITLSEVKHHPWVLRNLNVSPDAWLSTTDPTQSGVVKVSEQDVQCATQERGATDELPQIRNRPGIRRALNAALVKFPAFRRKPQAADGMGGRTRTTSIGSGDEYAGLDRRDSERKPMSPAGGGPGFPRTLTGESAKSGKSAGGGYVAGGNRGGWGNRSRNKQEAPVSPLPPQFPELNRVSSSSSATGVVRSLFPSRHVSSRDSRPSSASQTPATVGSPTVSSASATLALPPPEEGRRSLGKILSRWGGGSRSRASSQTSPPTDQEPTFEAPVVDFTELASAAPEEASALAPDVLDARFDSFGRAVREPGMSDLYPSNRSAYEDGVADLTEFEYSSDDDDDDEPYSEELLHSNPVGKVDAVSGWHAGFHHQDPNGEILVSPATDVSEDDSIAKLASAAPYHLDRSTPRVASTHEPLTSPALNLDLGSPRDLYGARFDRPASPARAGGGPPLQTAPPPIASKAAAEPLPAWAYEETWGYPHAVRDGVILHPVASGGKGRYDAFADAEEDDEEEEREVFIAPRRKRAATIERANN